MFWRQKFVLSTLAIANRSQRVTDGDLKSIVNALALQLQRDVAPLLRVLVPSLDFVGSGAIPAGTPSLVVFDTADQADALGYHDVGPDGLPYGKAFAGPVLDNGGTVKSGADSVSVTLSHELLEMLADPSANLWADAGDGSAYAYELCDPVEGDAYAVRGVSVSSFVLGAWFDPQAPRTAKFDFLDKLPGPFTMTPGGYVLKRTEAGEVQAVWGDKVPEWKRREKARARSRFASRFRHSRKS